MSRFLVSGRQVLCGFTPQDQPVLIEDGAVLVADGRIEAVGPRAELEQRDPQAERIGGPDTVVMPGLVNAHHHVGLTPFQLGSPDLPLELWFGSRLALRDVDLYLDTLYGAFEMIASGVTTVQHLHSRVAGGQNEMQAAAGDVLRAYGDLGMRVSYSLALRDQNRLVYLADEDFVAQLPPDLQPAVAAYFKRFTLPLEDQLAVFTALREAYDAQPLSRVQLAPANLHWLSDAGLEATAKLAEYTGAALHMHLLETPYQKAYAYKRHGKSAFACIDAFGLTGPQLTIGHGVWMEEGDIALCAHTGTRLCHNCSSNFRLASGHAPLNRFLAAGIPVALGIDEAGINDDHDMLQEMRLVYQVHRGSGIDAPRPTAAQILHMATAHGVDTTGFAGHTGRLAPGQAADMVLLDWKAVTHPYQDAALPLADIIVQRTKTHAVRQVMIGGEIVYRDGRFTRVDRAAVLAEIAARLQQPRTAAETERGQLSQALLPHMRGLYDGYL